MLRQTAVREALRTCREAEAQRDNLQQMLQEQQEARAEAEAAAESERASAQQAQQEAAQQAESQLEAVRQERGGFNTVWHGAFTAVAAGSICGCSHSGARGLQFEYARFADRMLC